MAQIFSDREVKNIYGSVQVDDAMVYRKEVTRACVRDERSVLGPSRSLVITDFPDSLEFKIGSQPIIKFPLSNCQKFQPYPYAELVVNSQDLIPELQLFAAVDIGDVVRLAYQTVDQEVWGYGGLFGKKEGRKIEQRPSSMLVRSVETNLFTFSLREDQTGYQFAIKNHER